MLHAKHISLTHGKTEAEATRIKFIANVGVIARVWIHFPPGCASLVKVRILHNEHPFLPVEADAYMEGDSFTYDLPIMYEIKETPEVITIVAWNTDDTYDHTIDVSFLIVDKMWVQPVGAYEGVIAALKSLFVRR